MGVLVVYYGLVEQLSDGPALGLVVEGLVLIAIVLVAPRGLWPTAASSVRRLRRLSSAPHAPGEPQDGTGGATRAATALTGPPPGRPQHPPQAVRRRP